MSEKLKIEFKQFGSYETNTYIITHEEFPEECIIIEAAPGSFEGLKHIIQKNWKIHLLITHGHWDHIFDAHLFQKYGAKMYVNEIDFKNLMVKTQPRHPEVKTVKNDEESVTLLKDGDELNLLGEKIQVFHTPGHTMGSSCFYFERLKKIYVGDTVFKGRCGRTDFEGGSKESMRNSVLNKLYKLPDDIDVYPGHEEFTTIGYEKKNNRDVKLGK